MIAALVFAVARAETGPGGLDIGEYFFWGLLALFGAFGAGDSIIQLLRTGSAIRAVGAVGFALFTAAALAILGIEVGATL